MDNSTATCFMMTDRSIMALAVLTCLFSSPLLAQERTLPTIDELLGCFVAAKAHEEMPGCEEVVPGALAMLTLPDQYAEYIDPLLDGLESIALSNENLRVRIAATHGLISAGHRDGAVVSSVPQRVQRLYEQSTDPIVRETLVEWSVYLADEAAAVAFLEHVARSDRSQGRMIPEEVMALDALTRMGQAGRSALAALSEVELRNETARRHFRHLASKNFRPPAERR